MTAQQWEGRGAARALDKPIVSKPCESVPELVAMLKAYARARLALQKRGTQLQDLLWHLPGDQGGTESTLQTRWLQEALDLSGHRPPSG